MAASRDRRRLKTCTSSKGPIDIVEMLARAFNQRIAELDAIERRAMEQFDRSKCNGGVPNLRFLEQVLHCCEQRISLYSLCLSTRLTPKVIASWARQTALSSQVRGHIERLSDGQRLRRRRGATRRD